MNERLALVPLAQVPAALREVEQAIRGQIEGLDAAQLNWQPGPRSWSIVQVLEHLSATAELYLPALHGAISDGLAQGQLSNELPHAGWFERLFLHSLRSRVKLKAPGSVSVRGASDLDPDTVSARWLACHDAIAAQAQRGEDLDPNRIRITSPLLSVLRLNLGVAFNVLIVHERRHLGQIRRVMDDEGFPGGSTGSSTRYRRPGNRSGQDSPALPIVPSRRRILVVVPFLLIMQELNACIAPESNPLACIGARGFDVTGFPVVPG